MGLVSIRAPAASSSLMAYSRCHCRSAVDETSDDHRDRGDAYCPLTHAYEVVAHQGTSPAATCELKPLVNVVSPVRARYRQPGSQPAKRPHSAQCVAAWCIPLEEPTTTEVPPQPEHGRSAGMMTAEVLGATVPNRSSCVGLRRGGDPG